MSKAVKLDHEFNIEKYSELLAKAQGGRSQTDFANDCGLSVAYICKHLNKKIDKAPIPSTLKKIAACAAGGVTYADLLEAAGYDSTKFPLDTVPDTPIQVISEFEKLTMATITAALSKSTFKWSSISFKEGTNYDFGITISDGRLSQWYFEFIHNSAISSPERSLQNRLMMYYGKIVTANHEPRTKFSFVTDSETTFNNLKGFPPYMLSMYVSVILIDTTSMNILKEEYLDSSLNLHPDMNTIYLLK